MDLWYFNIDDFPDEDINSVLSFLPAEIADKINRYKFVDDKKSRLIARLMLQKYVLKTTGNWSWDLLKTNINHKPFIENGPHFNITHSGKLVVVAFSYTSEIGIDIEKIQNIDVCGIANNFHEHEITHLKNNKYDLNLFYNIWTKKEALLKANGIGIVNGLNKVSVLEHKVFCTKQWYVQNLSIHSDYKCAICTDYEASSITIKHIEYGKLNKFINEKILS